MASAGMLCFVCLHRQGFLPVGRTLPVDQVLPVDQILPWICPLDMHMDALGEQCHWKTMVHDMPRFGMVYLGRHASES